MPTLLELQYALRRSILDHDNQAVAAMLADHVAPDRLDIYRNTIFSGLTKALRLSYPAVQRLVGDDFFDGAAEIFIKEHLPRAAYLDQYGDEFPEFLRRFPPSALLVYLADVATLEWAINCAIHAPDVEPLDLAQLAAIDAKDQNRVRFVAHPSVRLLRADHPVDEIWRAVLSENDATLATLDINAGTVYLLVERGMNGVEVTRLDEPLWRFLVALGAGLPMQLALESADYCDASAALAEHLARGRFVGFELAALDATRRARDAAA